MMAASSTTNLTAGSATALSISSRMRCSMYGWTRCSSRLRSTGLGKTIRPNFLRSTWPAGVRMPRSPQISATRARMSGCSRASCPSGSPATMRPPCRASALATVLLPAPMPPTRPRTGLRGALVMSASSLVGVRIHAELAEQGVDPLQFGVLPGDLRVPLGQPGISFGELDFSLGQPGLVECDPFRPGRDRLAGSQIDQPQEPSFGQEADVQLARDDRPVGFDREASIPSAGEPKAHEGRGQVLAGSVE